VFILVSGENALSGTGGKAEMKRDLLEISYRQFGSANRIQIVINKSTVNISGQGGYKRAKFIREENTPSSLWNQLIREAGKIKPGQLQEITKPVKKTVLGHFGVTIKTNTGTEQSKLFSSLDPPEQLKPLLASVFSAQSSLEEIVYSENGMSESLLLRVRREQTEIDSNNGAPGGKRQVATVTPADFWESLCVVIKEIDIESLNEMAPPSNRRATDMSLYAKIKIKFNGEWFEPESFDDDNPPKPLRQLIVLMNSARTGSFRFRQTKP